MNSSPTRHRYSCGIALHTGGLYICILDPDRRVHVHHNLPKDQARLLDVIAPYRPDIVIATECATPWYWLADLCARERLSFVLGPGLSPSEAAGGMSKRSPRVSRQLAEALHAGVLPSSYVYPAARRSTRDLLRRRMSLQRKRAQLLSHLRTVGHQYSLSSLHRNLHHRNHRRGLAERFHERAVKMSTEADLALIDSYTTALRRLEGFVLRQTKASNRPLLDLLQTIPGVGEITALVIFYETQPIDRFPSVHDFCSYAGLIATRQTVAGRSRGQPTGNVYLKWACSEAAHQVLRKCEAAKRWKRQREQSHDKGKALKMFTHKLGRTIYHMMKKRVAFDVTTCFGANTRERGEGAAPKPN